MTSLDGKTALVTGASRGIGRASAERLGEAGALVGVHYGHDEAGAKETLAAIEARGGQGFLVQAEFGVDGDVEKVLVELKAALGESCLDILVNNAGMLAGSPLDTVTREEFDHSFAVNVRAPFFLVQGVLPLIADGGRIITISSAVTRIASPFLHYAMAKGALEVMGHTLAQNLGPRGITVNTISPGIVDTALGSWVHGSPEIEAAVTSTIALGRLGTPVDVADVVGFLASDEARWVTGVTVDVSGGQWLGPAA
ncbi:SDR family NAD(P)-dependent oxidoreductase [Amycolatopsis plumensis]|uniref:SDR family NAD(P)-dependent oxidoreductase n=1 Tax=Amycolatopsis plumensis TaxID=236508 RepID=A0ABV5U7X6_9PSEU